VARPHEGHEVAGAGLQVLAGHRHPGAGRRIPVGEEHEAQLGAGSQAQAGERARQFEHGRATGAGLDLRPQAGADDEYLPGRRAGREVGERDFDAVARAIHPGEAGLVAVAPQRRLDMAQCLVRRFGGEGLHMGMQAHRQRRRARPRFNGQHGQHDGEHDREDDFPV